MEDKQQKQAEMMLKSLEMMAQSMDTTSSLDEMAKLVAEMIKIVNNYDGYLSNSLENLRLMFLEAQKELKNDFNDRSVSLRLNIKELVTNEINNIKSGLNDIKSEISIVNRKLNEIENKELDFEPIIEETLSRIKPETPEQTANRLNTKEEIIEQETIKGLVKRLDDLEEKLKKARGTTNIIGGATGGGHTAKVHDLSDSLNGVTKTFSLPAFWRVLSVYSTSTPVIFRPTVDYTVDGSTMQITFTDQISESTTLSAGQTLLVLYSE